MLLHEQVRSRTKFKILDEDILLLTITAEVKMNKILMSIKDVVQTSLSRRMIVVLLVNGDVHINTRINFTEPRNILWRKILGLRNMNLVRKRTCSRCS